MRTIKVLHITTIDLSLRYLLLSQLRMLIQHGYEVVGLSTAGPDVPMIEAAGIRHIPITMTRHISPLADLRALRQLYLTLCREQPTIVHTHTPKPSLLGQVAARLARVPIVVNTVHGFYFHDQMPVVKRQFYLNIERIAGLCSDAVLFENQEDLRTALRTRISRPSQARLLGAGIDIQDFDRTKLDPGALDQLRVEFRLRPNVPVIGFVGRLVTEKGLHELMQAARSLLQNGQDLQLLIIGPTDSAKADAITPAIAQEYDIAAHCCFLGRRNDLPQLYALMDIFVLPSYREGFPRTPMEAAAMELPCVVTDVRGCRDVVSSGVNGLLVPVRDSNALASALAMLLTNRDMARAMGAAGRQRALQQFDEQLIFERVRTEYVRLLAEKECKTREQLPAVPS